jgi:hypothetical protein
VLEAPCGAPEDAVRRRLEEGTAVAWRFDPEAERLSLTLPRAFGGATHARRLVGGYAFAGRAPVRVA